ncbi:MAG: nuclear transport factor 2 family protein, partial [Steroidobacteraceae bacterium]
MERAQAIRDIKNLQYTYAQYAQFGLWKQMAALFSSAGVLDNGTDRLRGPAAIAAFLTNRYGDGHEGLEAGAVNTVIIATPVVNLSVDGRTAKGRWNGMALRSDARGHASIEGGVYENDYVKEGGIWKIADLHFHPLYAGPYETGWTNFGGKDLPIVPYHFDGDSAGVPIPAPRGAPPKSSVPLASLEQRIR